MRANDYLASSPQSERNKKKYNSQIREGPDGFRFEMFAQYYEQVSEWIQTHQYKMKYQNAITMVSKSLGQILRLSGILNRLYIAWNLDEVDQFESNSAMNGESIDFKDVLISNDGTVPISVMAMQSALSIVSHSLNQNMILQNTELFTFDLSTSVPTIRENEQPVSDESVQQVHVLMETGNGQTQSTLPPPQHYTATALDAGKILVSGGTMLDASYLNKYRKIGQHSRITHIHDIFTFLDNNGFGIRTNKNTLVVHPNLLNIINENERMQMLLTTMAVSVSMLREALQKPNVVPGESKSKKQKKSVADTGHQPLPNSSNFITHHPRSGPSQGLPPTMMLQLQNIQQMSAYKEAAYQEAKYQEAKYQEVASNSNQHPPAFTPTSETHLIIPSIDTETILNSISQGL